MLALVAAALAAAARARHFPVTPDPIAVIVVAVGLIGGPSRAALVGLLAGWLSDLMPPGDVLVGGSALAYAAGGALAGRAHRDGRLPWWFVGAVALGAGLGIAAVEAALAWIAPRGGAPWGGIDPEAAASTLALTAVLVVLGAPLLARVDARLRPRA